MWEKQINQGFCVGPEQLCEGCAIYKDSSGNLGEEQVARGGKRGKGRCIKDPEFYFEHINFMLPVCCPKGSKSVRCSHKPLYSGSKEHSLWSQNVNLTAF